MTAPTTITAFRVHPIPLDVLDDIRARQVGVSGIPVEHLVAGGGEPLRCCLRDASAGEELILFGYQPPLPASPYRETGAIYAHRHRCGGPPSGDRYPADWQRRPQVLRAYDRRGWIHPATRVHDGQDAAAVITEILSDPLVVEIHSRNVAYGCYMFAITR